MLVNLTMEMIIEKYLLNIKKKKCKNI